MRWTILLLAALANAAHASSTDIISQATGAALQADEPRALELLQGVNTASLSEKDQEFVACMRNRFGSSPSAARGQPDSFTDRALAIYQRYWHAALTRPEMRDQQEKRLDASLRKLLGASKSAEAGLNDLLEKRLAGEGWYSLQGRTGLLRELMLWKTQDEQTIPVALPEGTYRVNVVLLNSFKSLGWSYYATCGRRATGGWTTEQALFAVVPRYDSLDSEVFRVSFLGHEAQHFADKTRFKDLKAWELEYRAKLTELVLANETRADVLDKFIEDQGDDPASPHSYADRRILTDLVKRLGLSDPGELQAVDPSRLQSAARDALLEDSRQRVAAGQLKPQTQRQGR